MNILAQTSFDLSSGTLERLAIAGGPQAALIVLMIFVQMIVIRQVSAMKPRILLLYATFFLQFIAALLWLAAPYL